MHVNRNVTPLWTTLRYQWSRLGVKKTRKWIPACHKVVVHVEREVKLSSKSRWPVNDCYYFSITSMHIQAHMHVHNLGETRTHSLICSTVSTSDHAMTSWLLYDEIWHDWLTHCAVRIGNMQRIDLLFCYFNLVNSSKGQGCHNFQNDLCIKGHNSSQHPRNDVCVGVDFCASIVIPIVQLCIPQTRRFLKVVCSNWVLAQ